MGILAQNQPQWREEQVQMEVLEFQVEPPNMVEVVVEEHRLLLFLVAEVALYGVQEAVEPEVDIPQETRLKPHLQVVFRATTVQELVQIQELMVRLLLLEMQVIMVLPNFVEEVVVEVEPRVPQTPQEK